MREYESSHCDPQSRNGLSANTPRLGISDGLPISYLNTELRMTPSALLISESLMDVNTF